MISQTQIDALIKRYQSVDPILYDILIGLSSNVFKSSPEETGQWRETVRIKNHLTTDFTATGGEQWLGNGVGAICEREYDLSIDGRFMIYSWRIDGATIVTGGIATELRLSLPPGYKYKTAPESANHMVCGAGNAFPTVAAGLEASIIFMTPDLPSVVRIFRPALAFWPASVLGSYVRGTIAIPVEKYGII